MAHFSDQFLDDLRARLPVSAVVGRKFKLKKEGREFRAIDDNSLTINDAKGLWYDQSKQQGGDIFKFEETYEGCTFPEAVERCAELAGVGVPAGVGDEHRAKGKNSRASPSGSPGDETRAPASYANGHGGDRAIASAGDRSSDDGKSEARREIEATFDYRAADGSLVMQVVRYVFRLPDGSYEKTKDGKRKKSFSQRKPDGAGGWLNKIGDLKLVPYRLPELIEAIADDRTIFIVEGEKAADRLAKEGVPVTTNPGGSSRWPEYFQEYFAGARVVIMPDNDDPGRKHADQVAANIADVAASVLVLELPDLPRKGDVVDWLAEGGTAAELAELAGAARVWQPGTEIVPWDGPPGTQPASTRFKLIHFGDVKMSTRPRYLVRGLIPLTGVVVIWGPPKCGKSFWTSDLLFHIALGWPYRGRKVEPGAVVYVILEGETGFSDRIEAFRQRYLAGKGAPPFYVVSQKLNLVADHVQLIADIRAQMPAGVSPAAVAIDTLNRSLQGSESSDQDMGNYVKAADAIRVAFDCVVPIVHHCGIESARPRGHSSLTGAADAQISVRRDAAKNVISTVEYMKDGAEGDVINSRLEVVTVGKEPDGHPITSCVVVQLGVEEAMAQKSAVQGFALNPTEEPVFRALLTALKKASKAPDAEMVALGVPADMFAVHYRDWREAYKTDGVKGGEGGEAPTDDAIRKQFDRYSRFMIRSGGVMGWKRPWLWWTGKHVRGFPETRPKDRTEGGQWADSEPDLALEPADQERTEVGQDPDVDMLRG